MPMNRDVDFLQTQIVEELKFAAEAVDPVAALVHCRMAAVYATRVGELRGDARGVRSAPRSAGKRLGWGATHDQGKRT